MASAWPFMAGPRRANPFYSLGMPSLDDPNPVVPIDAATPPGSPAPTPLDSDAASQVTPDLDVPDVSVAKPTQKDPRSGLSEKIVNDLQSYRQRQDQKVNMMDPEQLQKAYDAAMSLPAFQNQQNGLDDLRQLAAKAVLGQSPQMDLSPLAALTDSQTGSHLLPGYQRPENYQQLAANAMGAAQKLQSDQRDLAKEAIDAVSKQRAGYLTDLQKIMLNQKTEQGAQDPFHNMKPGQNVNNFMNLTRKESDKVRENDEQLSKILDAVNSGNPTAQRGVPVMIARLLEGARPAMQAANLETGDQSFIQRVLAIGEKLSSGQLTKENRAQYTQFLNDMLKVNSIVKAGMVKRWLAGADAMAIPPDQASAMIPAEWLSPLAGRDAQIVRAAPKPQHVSNPPKKPSQPSKPLEQMSNDELKAYIKANGGS